MSSFKEIKENLEAVSAIKTIATTYQEISQKEMTKIREKALKNKNFISRLAKIYTLTIREFLERDEVNNLPEKKKEKVAVFLSANARFYGSLLWQVWDKTVKYMKKNKSDLVVIAENGKYFAQNSEFKDFTYFDLEDEDPKEDDIKKIIDFIKEYKEITVFHGEFKNILTQEAAGTVIPGKLPKVEKKEKKDDIDYLFEPSAEKVLEFFETEILTSFFNQCFLEHRLSRHATRVVAMHQAGENAKERKEKLRMTIKRLRRKELDSKQFEITGPLQLWD